jgi:hypothetical protein
VFSFTPIFAQGLIELKCVDTISVYFEKGNSKVQNLDLLKQKLNSKHIKSGIVF